MADEAPEVKPVAEPEAEPEPAPEAQPESKPETTPEAQPEPMPEATPEVQPEPKPEAVPEDQPEPMSEAAPEAQPEPKPETAQEAQPEPKAEEPKPAKKPAADVKPEIVEQPKVKKGKKKKSIVLEAAVAADESAEIKWVKEGKEVDVSNEDKFSVTRKVSEASGETVVQLEISDAAAGDRGEYQVVAQNRKGSVVSKKMSLSEQQIKTTIAAKVEKPEDDKAAEAAEALVKPEVTEVKKKKKKVVKKKKKKAEEDEDLVKPEICSFLKNLVRLHAQYMLFRPTITFFSLSSSDQARGRAHRVAVSSGRGDGGRQGKGRVVLQRRSPRGERQRHADLRRDLCQTFHFPVSGLRLCKSKSVFFPLEVTFVAFPMHEGLHSWKKSSFFLEEFIHSQFI